MVIRKITLIEWTETEFETPDKFLQYTLVPTNLLPLLRPGGPTVVVVVVGIGLERVPVRL